ncbi:MAG: hypothetical protein JWM18_1526, partial [Chloroflexi bacterium]|nr:hypothetical protein [Chloroflexota bacterium]
GGEFQYLSQRFELRRLSVTGMDTMASFAAKVGLTLSRGPAAAAPAAAAPLAAGREAVEVRLRRS